MSNIIVSQRHDDYYLGESFDRKFTWTDADGILTNATTFKILFTYPDADTDETTFSGGVPVIENPSTGVYKVHALVGDVLEATNAGKVTWKVTFIKDLGDATNFAIREIRGEINVKL